MAASSKAFGSHPVSHVRVPQPRGDKSPRFGLFRFRSPLLTESLRFIFLRLLRCFTSAGLAPTDYEFIRRHPGNRDGFPHSEIHGSKPVCGSPWLIAAYHVLHRLLAPRHSPLALSSLITNYYSSYFSRPGFPGQLQRFTVALYVCNFQRTTAFPPKSCLSKVRVVGLTGLEPVTLRLSSACSNQLSYRPPFRGANPPPWWS